MLVGPGSALYGPDASAGVLTLQTKDPRQYPGTTVEVAGGARSYMDVQARHAGVRGNWGYKIMGEYQSADDYQNQLVYPSVTTPSGAAAYPRIGRTGMPNHSRQRYLAYYSRRPPPRRDLPTAGGGGRDLRRSNPP